MKRLKLNLDQLSKELEILDSKYLRAIKGGYGDYGGGSGGYGGYNTWEELWDAMQHGYVPPEGSYSPGGAGGYGDYGGGSGEYGGDPPIGGYGGGYGGYWGGYGEYGGGYGEYGGGYGEYGITGLNATQNGACVFDTLAYLSGIKGTYNDQSYWLNVYRSQNSDSLIHRNSDHVMTGVTTSTQIMINLMQSYFNVESINPSNLNNTLASGTKVLASLSGQGPDGESHSIIINCKTANGAYEIYDPTSSTTRVVSGGDLAGTNYLIAIH